MDTVEELRENLFEGITSSLRPTVWRILFKICPMK